MSRDDNKNDVITLRGGIWFHFEVDGKQINVHGSAWNGRERVWIDDELVSDIRSFSVESKHEIELNGRALTLEFSATSILRGDYRARVLENGVILREAPRSYVPAGTSGRRFYFRELGKWVAYGAVVGFAVGALIGFLEV